MLAKTVLIVGDAIIMATTVIHKKCRRFRHSSRFSTICYSIVL